MVLVVSCLGVDFKKLQSNPSSENVIFLGIYGGETPQGVAAPIENKAAVLKAYTTVVEDFYPFDVNVTTDKSVYDNTNKRKSVAILLSPWLVGGVSWGKFGGVSEWQALSPISRIHTISHELGHTFSLPHDGNNPQAASGYYKGRKKWGAIMGTGFSKDGIETTRSVITHWYNGILNDGSIDPKANQRNDLKIIGNILGYVDDDHPDITALVGDNKGLILEAENPGGIQDRKDTDIFSFTTTGGLVHLTIDPADIYSPNLNVGASIRDENGENIVLSGVESGYFNMGNTITGELPAGNYTLFIDGVKQDNDEELLFFNDYSSFGKYRINGEIQGFVPNSTHVASEFSRNSEKIMSITGRNVNLNLFDRNVENVEIAVSMYNLKGVKVINDITMNLSAGNHALSLNDYGAKELSAGKYIVSLRIKGRSSFREVKTITLY